ncbi:MAG: type II toxin-antitoxin system HicB family antitoxin [Pseudomonadota bacterium]
MAGYPIELTADDNGTLLVTSPVLPELTTYGEDEDAALRAAALAIEEAVAARMADGREIPIPTDWGRKGAHYVFLPALTAIKISLYRTLSQQGLNRAELCRRLGWHREQVDRLFRLDHASRLDQLEAAFAALGQRISLEVAAA